MKISIIGCGLIGKKRALAIEEDDKIMSCCDINEELARDFANEFITQNLHPTYFTNYKELLEKPICDTVIIAVVNKYVKEIVEASLKAGKHVLVEKPMGRNYKEALSMWNTCFETKGLLKVGFNHKFHPAIWKAKELFDANEIGRPLTIRAHYGHGGRPGMEKEWRTSKDLCGGGELLDQGVHLIDLSRWFAGEIIEVFGRIERKFWQSEVEDNAFMLLKSEQFVDIQLHVSWTNWKNSFLFEIFGDKGYLKITGLGGWYGQEKLEFGKRKKEGGSPDIQNFEFEFRDISWENEWKEFKESVKAKEENTYYMNKIINDASDGLKANQIIDAVYKSSLKNKIVKIK